MTDIAERLSVPIDPDDPDLWKVDKDRRDAADEIGRLRALVKELADDLECELKGRYPPYIREYPSEQRRYERDMANVYEARRALENKP